MRLAENISKIVRFLENVYVFNSPKIMISLQSNMVDGLVWHVTAFST